LAQHIFHQRRFTELQISHRFMAQGG
jgi:hypothetical protein